ncbi:hypothetical protein ALP39_00973 [Pseudomonas marginalis pv. marginalis]|nr:hypothetical protein ALP39_00973 [Pseudomonas marginalis pv. marginalis]
MDAARDRTTLEIVEADDLKLLNQVDTYGYVCHGHDCGVQAFPRAYRPENLVRAHFQVKSAHGHDCDVAAEEAIIARGSKASVQQELETSPGLSPARLHLVDTRHIVNPQLPPSELGTQTSGRKTSTGNTGQRPAGRRPANSIRPICRAFLRFPFDRHLSLHVDGIDTTTYQTVFKVLRSKGIEAFTRQRIFYSELAWKAAEETPEQLTITLNSGEWVEGKLMPYRVVVDWAAWSKTARSRLKNELEAARKENMAATKSKATTRSYLFFIGTQDAQTLSHFHVNDPRLICTVHDLLVFPTA